MDKQLKDRIYPTLSLVLICMVTTILLALVYNVAEDTIRIRAEEEAVAVRFLVMPGADRFDVVPGAEELDSSEIVTAVYAAYKGDSLIGYVFDTESAGYAGLVHSIVAVDTDEQLIQGLRITDSSETPGLGGNASKAAFYELFTGMGGPSARISVVRSEAGGSNEIEAITSATVTTYTVVNQANAALETAAALISKGGGQ